jgi:CBS domain-containing protein
LPPIAASFFRLPFLLLSCGLRIGMTNSRVRHLLVIDDGELAGIVSMGDIVKLRLEDLETETNVLRDAYLAVR